MRSKEFLIEYDRDKTIEQMGTAIANTAKLTNPRIKDEELSSSQVYSLSQNVLGKIESVDPTPNKKYVLWIVRQFVKNGLKLEDINEFLRNDLQDFHELPKQRKQQLGIETDLNKHTWRDLREIATKLKKATDLEEPVDAKLDYEHIDDMKVLYVGDMGQLIIPRTTEASCEIGAGTKWCTAATIFDNEFSNYASEGPLYVWIPSRKMPEKKISNKFQFHFESAQFMDENDEQIESDLFRYFRNEHPVLKKLFAKGEEVIAQDPKWAYSYALDVIKGEFLAGEAAIAQDPEWAYYYARDVIKVLGGRNRFPAGEEAIAQDLQLAYSYARDVIEGRFPEGEAAIAQDPEWAYYYALDVIKVLEGKNRFPIGEEVIAQDPKWAYYYARFVIGGRFPAGEEAIARDPEWIYQYALDVIKGRWTEPHRAEAEANIKKNGNWWSRYVDFVKQSGSDAD